MFFTFVQNNSGGVWKGYHYIIIEANSASEANELAEDNGIYFNGVNTGKDCSCCGNRWSKSWEEDATEVPMIYGEVDLSDYNVKIVYK